MESKLFVFLQNVKEPIYREVSNEYLCEDVSDKIKEWCDEKGDYVLSLFSLEDIEALVNSWQNRLSNVSYATTVYVDDIRIERRKAGDINTDYRFNASDLVALRQMLLGMSEFDFYADVNEDSVFDIIDLVRLKKLTAK